MVLTVRQLDCKRCGHRWIPNRPVKPKVCPKCKNPNWNKIKKLKQQPVEA